MKAYIKPALEIVRIKTGHLMTTSPLALDEDGGTGKLNGETATGDAMSRGRKSIWEY